MSKHTPGPWIISKEPSDVEKFIVATRGSVCEVLESFPAENVWGNAHLIAAAPDLLSAAERVLEKLDHPTLGVTIYDADSLRAAIAKARGEA